MAPRCHLHLEPRNGPRGPIPLPRVLILPSFVRRARQNKRTEPRGQECDSRRASALASLTNTNIKIRIATCGLWQLDEGLLRRPAALSRLFHSASPIRCIAHGAPVVESRAIPCTSSSEHIKIIHRVFARLEGFGFSCRLEGWTSAENTFCCLRFPLLNKLRCVLVSPPELYHQRS